MAAIGRLGRAVARPLLLNRAPAITGAARSMGYWNKDWKPGQYPKTEEERLAAAKKYGLRPEDYEPYADDGMGYGDYPKLPRVSTESRSGHLEWDIPELKKNYGEPIHVDADAMVEDRWNPNIKYRFSFPYMSLWFLVVVGGLSGVYYLTLPYPFHPKVMPKQMPLDGAAHYTFEKVD